MANETEVTLGERIRDRRRSLRMSQKEIADKIGVSVAAISLWEKDKASPSSDNMKSLAAALNCSPTWLLMEMETLTVTPAGIENQYTESELKTLSAIFDLLPKKQRNEIVRHAQSVLDDYIGMLSGAAEKIKSFDNNNKK